MKMAKKTWKKPKLVVLTRGKPDEFVLTACKMNVQGTNGPDGYDNDGCRFLGADCSTIGS